MSSKAPTKKVRASRVVVGMKINGQRIERIERRDFYPQHHGAAPWTALSFHLAPPEVVTERTITLVAANSSEWVVIDR